MWQKKKQMEKIDNNKVYYFSIKYNNEKQFLELLFFSDIIKKLRRKYLKSKYERMPPKTITYRSYKNFTEEQFKEAIRSDCSFIEARLICHYEKDLFMWK